MSRTVGLVVPAFRADVDVLARYVRALHERLPVETIRVELDDPAPGTVEALEDCPATVHAVDGRRGKGAAITAGFEAIEADVLAFVDADGSTPPASVEAVVDPVLEERTALGVGSRRHPDADVRNHQTLVRRRFGDAFAWLARRLLAVSLADYQCGAKAVDAGAWQVVRDHLCEAGFAWDVELIAVADALGYRIEEVPVTWIDGDESTVAPLGTAVELSRALVRSRHRAKYLRGDPVHAAIATRTSSRVPVAERLASDPSDE